MFIFQIIITFVKVMIQKKRATKIALLLQSSAYRRANMTYHLFLYEGATWILPEATVEFREVLDEAGRGIRSDACPSGLLNSNFIKIWGTVMGDKAHLLIATGDN